MCPNCATAYRKLRSDSALMSVLKNKILSKSEQDIKLDDHVAVAIDDDDELWFTQTHDMQSITMLPEALLYKEFGVNAEFIIDHAWGRESCTMADIHNYRGKSRSLSNSQILFEDYDVDGARIVMKEMVENLVLELVEENLYAKGISLYIRYSKDCIPATGGAMKLTQATCSIKKIQEAFGKLFIDKVRIGYGIRQIGISLTNLTYEPDMQLSFFEDPEDDEKEKQMEVAMVDIRTRFGKNALLKGFNLFDKATGMKRNTMVGGHNG